MKFLPKNANKKQKKKFNKEFSALTPDEQAEVIKAELVGQISNSMNHAICNAVITGMNLAYKQLYEDYVSKIDDPLLDSEMVEALLSFIRMEYVKYKANEQMNEQEDKESDDKVQ